MTVRDAPEGIEDRTGLLRRGKPGGSYMHGVTRELWQLARASRDFHTGATPRLGVDAVYRALLETVREERDLRLRVLPDIMSGASAGGINTVFLAQAIYSGQSLEPLTNLWLEVADVDELVDPAARLKWRFSKIWAQAVRDLAAQPSRHRSGRRGRSRDAGGGRAQGFASDPRGAGSNPRFRDLAFHVCSNAPFSAMADSEIEDPLLPPGHPLDLYVTATDFHGYLELLRLHSPPVVEDTEHRMPITFRARTPQKGGTDLANPLELVFAARSTASFPGAFPPLRIGEIDRLSDLTERAWSGREDFLERIMPVHVARGKRLITYRLSTGRCWSTSRLPGPYRPCREDRRSARSTGASSMSIPGPTGLPEAARRKASPSASSRPSSARFRHFRREQPIRDNLEQLEEQSREAERLSRHGFGAAAGSRRCG